MFLRVVSRLGRDLVAVLGRLGWSCEALRPQRWLMKNSREHLAQLGSLSGREAGGPGRPGAAGTRFGGGKVLS